MNKNKSLQQLYNRSTSSDSSSIALARAILATDERLNSIDAMIGSKSSSSTISSSSIDGQLSKSTPTGIKSGQFDHQLFGGGNSSSDRILMTTSSSSTSVAASTASPTKKMKDRKLKKNCSHHRDKLLESPTPKSKSLHQPTTLLSSTISIQVQPPSTPPKKDLTPEELKELIEWIDATPFQSKTTNNLHRDFSDAVLLAELIHHHAPKLISLHSYSRMSGMRGKLDNWDTLNNKVLIKLGLPSLCASDVYDLANAKDGAIESLLFMVREKLEAYHQQRLALSSASSTESMKGKMGSNFRISSRGSLLTTPSTAGTVSSCPSMGIFVDDYEDEDGDVLRSSHQLQKTRVFEDTCTVYASYETHKFDNEEDEEVVKIINCIVYEGRRLIPDEHIDKYKNKLDIAHETNQGLQTKIRRLETLVGLKEDRLEDLTRELHQLKLQLEEHHNQ